MLASPLPEVKKIIDDYGCGAFIENHHPQHIAACFTQMLNDTAFLKECRTNAEKASILLNGETEQLPLLSLFAQLKN